MTRTCSDKGLRPYQLKLYHEVHDAWDAGYKGVCLVLPTGGGKSRTLAAIVRDHQGASCTIAHRQELVSQLSIAFARNNIEHRIIGPNKLIRTIVRMHMKEFGKSFYNPNSNAAVAGVDTLVRRTEELKRYLPTVTLCVQDETHHLLKENKWGTAAQLFPRAKLLGVTATPTRADGKGLGSHHDGLFDTMVEGPNMRDLINEGFLTEYRIFAPPNDVDLSHVKVSQTTGDYNVNQMRDAVGGSSLIVSDGKSRVVGDIVSHYKRIADGKLGVTFVPSVEQATEVARQFNAAGVPAEVLSAKTPDEQRGDIMRQFRDRKILQLVNVDLLGEGVDVPAIECVSMARPTASYSLYIQQFGRALRLLDGKKFAIVIDHAGNVMRHGLPDAKREWTLDRREKRGAGDDDATPLRTCMNDECYQVYERYLTVCPYCDTPIPKPAPSERKEPELVDGDLTELDAETLATMRGEVARVDTPLQDAIAHYRESLVAKHAQPLHIMAHTKRFAKKLEAQQTAIGALREIMAHWAGHHRAAGRSDSEIFRRFYLRYGVDWLSAQALEADKAFAMGERVALDIGKLDA